MTMMKRRNIIMVMMTSLLLGSCSSEDILSVPNGNGRIRFDVGVSQSQEVMEMPISTSPMTCGNDTLYAHSAALRNIELHNDVTSKTRGKEVDNSSFYADFGLYGYTYNSDQSWKNNGSELQPTIKNEQITKGDTWTSSTYLPGQTKKMALFAYAPYINAEIPVNAGISVADGKGAPQLTYTIASVVSNQVDLLVAKSFDVVGNSSSVALDFKHALTAVKFAIRTITGFTKITKIKISGVKNSGTLSLDGDNWKLNDATADYTIAIAKEIDLSTSGDITGSSNDLMLLMPQTLPSGAKLEVTMTNDIGTKTFSAPLTGVWKKGYTVTYQLSVDRVAGEFHFEVTPSTSSIPKEGGDIELKVKSYYQITGGAQVPIPWSGTYNIGSNQYTLSGDGSVNDDIRKISVPANNSALTHTETLKANQSKGTAQNPWNLSNSQGKAEVENTANCYVVNSQGTYSIPLVYGCAIKDGQENAIAYGKGTYKGITYNSNTFKRHDDNLISRPYLKDNGITVDDAELLWQEVQGMITEVKVENEKIVFTIGDKIAQGNALIAAKSGSTIVWSWHIWVTDRNINATEKVTTKFLQSHDYDFMPVALGWVDSSEGVSPRLYTFNLTQSQSNKDLSATVNQAGTYGGTCPYYQWGRKDPLMPSKGIKDNTETKPCYDISGNTVSFTANTSDNTIKGGILFPGQIIISSNYNWDTGTTRNDNWNAINGDTQGHNYNEVVKTVYDPSPVGFKMPPPYAFTGFTDSGSYLDSSSNTCIDKTNGDTNGFNEGYNFYTNSNNTTTTYWRACGYRAYNGGSLNNVGSYGHYWSAGPYTDAKGCHLVFNSSGVSPQDGDNRAFGFSVRPVSEQ